MERTKDCSRCKGWRSGIAAVAIFALYAAGCGADDPIESVGGVELCVLEAAAETPLSDDSGQVEAEAHIEDEPDDAHIEDEPDDAHIEDEPDDAHIEDEPDDAHIEDEPDDAHIDDEMDDAMDMGAAGEVDWLVDIEMDEFSYGCVLPTLEAGTVVAMHFTNVGVIEHEAVIGDLGAQNDAEAVMSGAVAGGGDHGHETPSITLGAGESGVLEVVLDTAGPMIIGCHIPGHWDSGMRSDFEVT